jgi:periplasmic divalent cation tolerance protein
MTDKIVVFVTVGGMETAEKIGKTLVEERLAACVNVVPGIRSFYRWEGKIVDDSELLLVIKTRSARFEELKARVLDLHTYDLPEIVGLPIERGHQAYLDWIEGET